MQYFRRGEEKGGNAPRREPKADAASDVLTRGWENRDRNNIRHRHALRRRRLRRARKRRAKRQKFKNTLRSCLTSPSTTWVIIASFRMPGSMLTVRHSETQSPTLMRPTTPGGEIRCPQKNETGYFECPRLHNSAETIPEP